MKSTIKYIYGLSSILLNFNFPASNCYNMLEIQALILLELVIRPRVWLVLRLLAIQLKMSTI